MLPLTDLLVTNTNWNPTLHRFADAAKYRVTFFTWNRQLGALVRGKPATIIISDQSFKSYTVSHKKLRV